MANDNQNSQNLDEMLAALQDFFQQVEKSNAEEKQAKAAEAQTPAADQTPAAPVQEAPAPAPAEPVPAETGLPEPKPSYSAADLAVVLDGIGTIQTRAEQAPADLSVVLDDPGPDPAQAKAAGDLAVVMVDPDPLPPDPSEEEQKEAGPARIRVQKPVPFYRNWKFLAVAGVLLLNCIALILLLPKLLLKPLPSN